MSETNKKWTFEAIREIYNLPLLDLIFKAAEVHRKHNKPGEVQISSLVSLKTGGCTEDCGYCSQSAHNNAEIEQKPMMQPQEVYEAALKAKQSGASRLCMGTAWREVSNTQDFEQILEIIKGVNGLGLEVCCTLGMLTEEQAQKLADAGLHSYNHNIDTSKDFYKKIITTRSFEDRLKTLENVRKARISVCSGGIIGMGETAEDRISMLHTLVNLEIYPESVPINALVPIHGTPLEDLPRVSTWDIVRMVATARIIMPDSLVRLSAGREQMSQEAQALCFIAGANSIFTGEKLLTTPNAEINKDMEMLEILGLKPRAMVKETNKDVSVTA